MQFLKVKNFERFQHYKDRNPPWIKLYFEILSDYAFAKLPDASKFHLVAMWLLASRGDGLVPYDRRWIAAKIGCSEKIDFDILISSGFVELCNDASKTLATCKQNAIPSTEGEKEKELETPLPPKGGRDEAAERRKRPEGPRVPEGYSDGFARFWKEWPKHDRKVGKSECYRVWMRKNLEPLAEQVIRTLLHCKVSQAWLKKQGEFIPMPKTWLNQTPWETELTEMVSEPPHGGEFDSPGFERAEVTPELLEVAYPREGK